MASMSLPMAGLTIHRPYPGEHEASDNCWCQPVVLTEEEILTLPTEDIMAMASIRPN